MKRTSLLIALLLSMLLHLALLGSGLLPDFRSPPETPLQPIHIKLATLALSASPRQPSPRPPKPGGLSVAQLPPAVPRSPGLTHQDASSPQVVSPHAAAASAPAVETASAPVAEDTSAPVEEVPAAIHERRKHFPLHARLNYQVYYGALMAGSARIDWQRQGTHYLLESRIQPIIGPLLRYVSEGSISPAGLRPDSYTAWRNSSQHEHARFDWNNATLEYGEDDTRQVALQPGAQDVFSLIYQLALKGTAPGTVQITTGKKVYVYPLKAVGEADYDTGFGIIHALVFRAEGDGDRTEFWLAPDFANQPVRIIRTDTKMKLDMRATDIIIDDQSVWRLPTQTYRKKDR